MQCPIAGRNPQHGVERAAGCSAHKQQRGEAHKQQSGVSHKLREPQVARGLAMGCGMRNRRGG